MFNNEQNVTENLILGYLEENGFEKPAALEWKRIPFSGEWGISTSLFKTAALESKKTKGVNVKQKAQEIASGIRDCIGLPEGFSRIEAVNGYLNLYFSASEYTQRVVDTVLTQTVEFGRGERTGEKVMVEFSQPNTHKAFHVGHLRNVILGNAVCNILDFAGYDVVRANYIGDIGLHVIKWLWNYITLHDGETPGEDKTRWMGDIYSEADRRFSESEQAEVEVRQLFSRWDQREEEIVELWRKTRGWSLEGFNQIYELLDVRFDRIYFESEVEDSGKELIEELISKGIARDERPDEAVIVPLDELLGLEDNFKVLVVLRSDGTSLYATKDLSLAINKFNEYDIKRSIYVIDVRQSFYMQQIYKTLEIMGYSWAKDCYHLAYEIVNLPGNVTMSSRDGTVVLLDDLIQEATDRAKTIVETKNPELDVEKKNDIALSVALGALKYSMLSRDNTKIVTFDWDRALDYNGQAAPYIQYASVRANSILRKVGMDIPGSIRPEYELKKVEIELIDLISMTPNIIERSAREYKPLLIANHSFDLAKTFNDFYMQCPVLKAEEPIRSSRLRLVAAARQAMENCLRLLGIKAPDIM